MQNKGFVKVLRFYSHWYTMFYLSFSFVTHYYTNKAKEYAKGDVKLEQNHMTRYQMRKYG